jgi:hypothetical protein
MHVLRSLPACLPEVKHNVVFPEIFRWQALRSLHEDKPSTTLYYCRKSSTTFHAAWGHALRSMTRRPTPTCLYVAYRYVSACLQLSQPCLPITKSMLTLFFWLSVVGSIIGGVMVPRQGMGTSCKQHILTRQPSFCLNTPFLQKWKTKQQLTGWKDTASGRKINIIHCTVRH